MEQIRRLEEILGDYKYQRPVPLIRNNTWLRRYIEEVKRYDFNPAKYFKALIRSLRRNKKDCLFYNKSNLILMGSGIKNKLELELSLYHEISHRIMKETKPAASPSSKSIMTVVLESVLKRKTLTDELEKAVIRGALEEGMCDYLAIEAQKLEVKEGRKPEEVHCYTREWVLVKFKEHDEKVKLITEPTPLSKKKPNYIKEIFDNYVKLIPKMYKYWKPIRWVYGLAISRQMEGYFCHAGYYLARSSCEAHPELGKKQVFQSLLLNPPENIHEFQQRIIDNMTKAQQINENK